MDDTTTLCLPIAAFTHSSLRDVQKIFHEVLADESVIKVTYGLPAAIDYLESWVPKRVLLRAKSVFDVGYLYHGYPSVDSVAPGGFVGYRELYGLGDANSLESIFEASFHTTVEIDMDIPVWDESFWNVKDGLNEAHKEAAQILTWKQLDLLVLFALTGSTRCIPLDQHREAFLDTRRSLAAFWQFPE